MKNGHAMMTHVVGTGCMATSVIGAFAAVEPDLALAAAVRPGLLRHCGGDCGREGIRPGVLQGSAVRCLYPWTGTGGEDAALERGMAAQRKRRFPYLRTDSTCLPPICWGWKSHSSQSSSGTNRSSLLSHFFGSRWLSFSMKGSSGASAGTASRAGQWGCPRASRSACGRPRSRSRRRSSRRRPGGYTTGWGCRAGFL